MYEMKFSYTTYAVQKSEVDSDYIEPDNIKQLLDKLNQEAKRIGGHHNEDGGISDYTNTIGLQDKDKKYFPQEVHEFFNNHAYVFAGSAAFALFLRNVSGTIKDVIDIMGKRSPEKSVTVIYKCKKIPLKNGDDLEKIILALESDKSPPVP